MLKHLFIALTIILHQINLFGQNKTIDSLKFALKNAKHDTTRCNILSAIIDSEIDGDIWSPYNDDLLILAKKNSLKDGELKVFYLKHLASALNNSGFLADNHNDISKAFEYYNKSLNLSEDIGDKHGIALSLNNIATIYDSQGDISRALDYYHKSLKIREEIGDKSGIATSLNNLGSVYNNQGDTPKALEYYSKSLQIMEGVGDKAGVANSLNNIGVIYIKQNNLTMAFDYFIKCLKIQEVIEDKNGLAVSLNNIGYIYVKQGDILKGLEYYNKSLMIREDMEDMRGIALSLNNIATLTMVRGQINEAFVYANKSMKAAKATGFPESIKNSARILKEIYQKQNKYKEAFEMYEMEIKMRDSINNQETQKAAVKKQMQYAYEKKELEMKAEQDKKDVIAKSELNQKEKERNYFIVGFGLVLVLALFILRGYKQKQKANAIILEQKKLVEEKQKEILDSIHYAKRIQTALLPSEKYIEKSLTQLIKKV